VNLTCLLHAAAAAAAADDDNDNVSLSVITLADVSDALNRDA